MKSLGINIEVQSNGVTKTGKENQYRAQSKTEQFQSLRGQDYDGIHQFDTSNGIAKRNQASQKKIIIAIAAVIIFILSCVIYGINRQRINEKKFQYIQHRLTPLTFTYPTVGVPIPGKVFNSTKVKLQEFKEYDKLVLELLQPYNDTDCQYGRYGDAAQGGYVVCKNFFARSEALLNIGVNGADYDKFGCQLSSDYKIPNYLYDCTNNEQPVCPTNNDGNIFSQTCVGDQKEKANGFMFLTLKDMIKDRRLTKKHITLKLDTEGGEYGAFKYFPMEDLDYIDQIVMEFHFGHIYPEYWGHIDIMRSLMQKFVIVNFHPNNIVCYSAEMQKCRLLTSNANEVAMVNKKLIKLKSNSRSFALNSNNVPNIGWPDCQIK